MANTSGQFQNYQEPVASNYPFGLSAQQQIYLQQEQIRLHKLRQLNQQQQQQQQQTSLPMSRLSSSRENSHPGQHFASQELASSNNEENVSHFS